MAISIRHILEQGPMLRTLGATALAALGPRATNAPATPGPWLHEEIAPPSELLIRAFVRNAGGDPSSYRGFIPPHLFPQWTLPIASKALAGIPYPMLRVMNAGCRFDVSAPLPLGEPLEVQARLESIDDNGARAILKTRVVTGTKSVPNALTTEVHAFVPLAKPKSNGVKTEKKAAITTPTDAREIAYASLRPNAGLDFAKLTGDFNPIHWIPAYARASGFRAPILHGFGTLAVAAEAIVRRVLSGNARDLRSMDVQFRKPLTLPARVGVYVADATGDVYVASAPGGVAYLAGKFVVGEVGDDQ